MHDRAADPVTGSLHSDSHATPHLSDAAPPGTNARAGLRPDDATLVAFARSRQLLTPSHCVTTPIDFDRTLRAILDDSRTKPAPAAFCNPLTPLDDELDDYQRDAVARALSADDLILINGRAGTGKKRVVREIVQQVIRSGGRVLLMARQLERLPRFIDMATAVTLPCKMGPQHLPEYRALLCHRADEFAATIAAISAALATDDATFDRLDRLAAESDAMAANLMATAPTETAESLRLQPDNVLAQAVANVEDSRATVNARIAGEQTAAEQALAESEAALHAARETRNAWLPLEEAGRSGRFWSAMFWKARLHRTLPTDLESANKQIAEAEAAFAAARMALVAHEDNRRKTDSDAEIEIARQIEAALQERSATREKERQLLQQSLARLKADYELIAATLPVEQQPAECSPTSLDEARERRASATAADRQSAALAAAWRERLERDDLPAGLAIPPCAARVVLATPRTLAQSPAWIADGFDIAIVLDAHQCDQADLRPMDSFVRRWVLVGEPVASRRDDGTFFHRLWAMLHFDAWACEGNRRVFRLHPVAQADRSRLETERVADRPEIELRILPNGDDVVLAEVSFPIAMPDGEMRQFLFHELGEIPCRTPLRSGRWDEIDGALIFRLNPTGECELPPVSLAMDDGVELLMHHPGCGHQRNEFTFRFPEGWDRDAGHDWLVRRLARHDAGRTIELRQPYRQSPAMHQWMLMSHGLAEPGPLPGVVQFEAVPRRAPAAPRIGGAGYEIDMADPQQRDLIPAELTGRLPSLGFINLPEAQAVAECARHLPNDAHVAITAVYPAQVDVLKHYLPGDPRVRPLADVLSGEFDVVLVCLTRSHVARAVTFSNRVDDLPRLFGRVRSKLVIIGDPGTLGRRARWEGAIDQFDAATGERERCWVSALLAQQPVKPATSGRPTAGLRV